MKDDDIDLARDLMIDDEGVMTGSIGRWLPTVVVVSALTGFIGLAWYAYHSGAQSMKEEEILVVEADKTPMKEKPADPGGMKFPNQDKTIFETFASNAQVPPKVEKLLPSPEEPLPKEKDISDTQTFVNDRLHQDPNKTEQVIGEVKEKPAVSAALDNAVNPAPAKAEKVEKKAEAKPVEAKPVAAPAVKEEAPNISSYSKPLEKSPAAEKPAKSDSGAKVQLGAYRSESEAKSGWEKMQKQYPMLAGKSPIIVKADLGKKGIYYRLRTGGFANGDEAKTFCAKLSAKGQNCITAKD